MLEASPGNSIIRYIPANIRAMSFFDIPPASERISRTLEDQSEIHFIERIPKIREDESFHMFSHGKNKKKNLAPISRDSLSLNQPLNQSLPSHLRL